MRAPVLAATLLASVVLANVLTARLGLVSAGFGLLVTAGTYAAGFSLGLRDALDHAGGLRWVLTAIAAGVALSALFGSGRIALASAVAFGLGELVDLAVYRPLRRRGWRRALVLSNAAGGLVDTCLFLAVAGFGITGPAVAGQVVVKAVWVTGAALLAGEGLRRALRRNALV